MADGIVSRFQIYHEIDAKLFKKFPILNMEHESSRFTLQHLITQYLKAEHKLHHFTP